MIIKKELLSIFVKKFEESGLSLRVFPNKSKNRFGIYSVDPDEPNLPPIGLLLEFDESIDDAICPLNPYDCRNVQERLNKVIHGREAELYTLYYTVVDEELISQRPDKYTKEDLGKTYSVIKQTPSGNILFVDTETNGLPKDDTKSYTFVDNWPAIHQIAWIIYTKNGDIVVERNYEIGTGGSLSTTNDINYIAKSLSPIHEILPIFLEDLSKCDVIVGHNVDFDVDTILCELYRLGLDTKQLESKERFCTMKNGVEACGFNTPHGKRFPKLQELYMKLFHRPFENAHDAYCDIRATASCFWELFNRKYLNLLDFPSLMDNNKKKQLAWRYSDEAEKILAESVDETSFFYRMLKTNGIHLDELESSLNRGFLSKEESDIVRSALKEERVYRMRKPIDLHKKAAQLGYSFSMFRIGQINYYLEEYDEAATWYRSAIEAKEGNIGFARLDYYFECASACSMSSGDNRLLSEKYYSEWAKLCDYNDEWNPLPIEHLILYLDALGYGKYGVPQNIRKAIAICEEALLYTSAYSTDDRMRIRGKMEMFKTIND